MDPDRARQLLAAERARIERSLAQFTHPDEAEAEEWNEFDPGDLGAELEQDEFAEGYADDLREQLAAVERAERRLAAGTYGLSVESGRPIPDERLVLLPAAERTAEEQAELERRG
jgi:DnaK suppressor protein